LVEESVNKTSKPCNSSYNSYYSSSGWSLEQRIYHTIDSSEIELRPVEIAKKIHGVPRPSASQCSSVRVLCRKLLEKGLVLQPYPGAYCNKITYGMRFVPLCVHNISLQSNICQSVRHWETDEIVGGVKIHVCFGSERRKVSGFISCDVGGMTHDACLLALNRWFDIVEGKLGFGLTEVKVTTFELNKDYHGVRVDGVSCITRSDLFGMIDRVYQKEEQLIRKERKVLTPMSINLFEEAIQKGVVDLEHNQERFELHREVKQNTEALKFTNSRLLQMEKFQEATFQVLNKINTALERLNDPEKLDPKQAAEGQRKMGEYMV